MIKKDSRDKNLMQARQEFFGGILLLILAGAAFFWLLMPEYQKFQRSSGNPDGLYRDLPVLETPVKNTWQNYLLPKLQQIVKASHCTIVKLSADLNGSTASQNPVLGDSVRLVKVQLVAVGVFGDLLSCLGNITEAFPIVRLKTVRIDNIHKGLLKPNEVPQLQGTFEFTLYFRNPGSA